MTSADDDDLDRAEQPDGATGVPDFTSLSAALEHALEATPHLPRDRAVIQLARKYAAMLDDVGDRLDESAERIAASDGDDGARDFGRMVTVVVRLGPRLEAVLDRLGMTPGARRGDGSPHVPDDPAAAALAAQRAEYAARVDFATVVDPAVTGSLP